MNHTLSIESLELDLRGLPRETAEAVPGHLSAALREVVGSRTLEGLSEKQSPPPLSLSLDRGESAPAVARQIARALVDSLQTSNVT